ncbi:polyprotein P2a [Cynosurus mottle virus]|uniref:Polyprotein P2a n=1 Tax=Cynosurus mottle virus TaxID=2931826 RepID=A0A8T9JD87_9VIRU|nr:polyprotein P2a [Cynosurus mottle virus]WMX25425.1 P2a protein [Cynosurus mottle virus]
MAFSVAGLTERSVLRNSLVIGLVLLVSTWNQWKESPNAGRLWLAIPLLLVCNWIVWKVSIVAQRHLLGVTTEVRRPRDMATIQSPPRFDPLHGFVASALYQGAIIEVVMDVCTAFSSSPKLDQGLTPEMAMPNSPTNRVAPNSEPDSLVTLYRDGAVIGFGARIKTPRGEDLLLTAYHVWELEPEHMAKRGKCIPLRKCRLVYKSTSEMLDFAMVEVPSSYWTSVGVKSARLKKSGARTVVRAFGGQSSQDLFSTSGVATYGKTPLELVHTATTFPGWSGTPLYSKGNVVGLHFGSEKAKLKNRACNIAGLFEILPRNVEVESSVMADDSSQQELEHAEWVERMKQGVPYEQYEINDEDYMVGYKDYHRLAHFDAERRLNDPSYRSWADRADSDDESLGSIYETPIEVETSREVDEFHECEEPENPSSPPTSAERVRTPVPEVRVDVMMEESRVRPLLARKSSPAPKVLTESSARAASPRLDIGRVEKSTASQRVQKETNVPLNCQRADSLRGCPPLANLLDSEDTPGLRETASTMEECDSFKLGDRIAGLEKLVERLSHQISVLQQRPSLSSPVLVGPTVAPQPKDVPCSSKQDVSKESKPQKASKKPAPALPPATPKQNPVPASELNHGSTLTSETKSRKSRSRKRSTGKPVPASPSQ